MAAAASEEPSAEDVEADIREYAQSLGADLETEPELRWVVQEAFNAPLPAAWSEHTDDAERVYFFHEVTSQSTWEHPMDAVYRELLGFVKQVTSEAHPLAEVERLNLIQEHLRQVHESALDKLEGWSGPYAAAGGEYYYNESLQLSTWESPLAEKEDELSIRHAVLCRCLLPDCSGPPGADGQPSRDSGPDLLKSLQLPLGLIRRDDTGEQPPATPSARSFHTARSACSTRSQQLSGRTRLEERRPSARGTSPAVSRAGGRSPTRRSPRQASGRSPRQAADDDDGEHEFTFGSTNKVQLPKFAPREGCPE